MGFTGKDIKKFCSKKVLQFCSSAVLQFIRRLFGIIAFSKFNINQLLKWAISPAGGGRGWILLQFLFYRQVIPP
jgi:hypothetical protein